MPALVFGGTKSLFEHEGSEGGEENTTGLAFVFLATFGVQIWFGVFAMKRQLSGGRETFCDTHGLNGSA
jgi:hypothetical protein